MMWQMGIGGAERAVYQLIREQRARGVEADVVIGTEAGLYGDRVRETGAAVFELGARGATDLVRQRKITSILRSYTVAHFHVLEPALIAAAASGRRARFVYTHRGGVRSYGATKRARHSIVRPFLKRRFHAISANTRQSARAIAAMVGIDPSGVAVIYNGIDFSLLAPLRPPPDVELELRGISRDSLLIGTAANLQRWKRVDRLVRAVARLEDDAIRCVILGDGPARSELEDLARALGLTERVTFLGRKDHVGDYLQLLDVFVLPSGPEEGFGNAAVEAMGVGIPTVVFVDGGGLTEHVIDGETGRTVRSVDDLVRVVTELASDRVRRQELGTRGERYVRSTYSLDAMFERYARLYDRVLTPPG